MSFDRLANAVNPTNPATALLTALIDLERALAESAAFFDSLLMPFMAFTALVAASTASLESPDILILTSMLIFWPRLGFVVSYHFKVGDKLFDISHPYNFGCNLKACPINTP
jgi:hypothetical protein